MAKASPSEDSPVNRTVKLLQARPKRPPIPGSIEQDALFIKAGQVGCLQFLLWSQSVTTVFGTGPDSAFVYILYVYVNTYSRIEVNIRSRSAF